MGNTRSSVMAVLGLFREPASKWHVISRAYLAKYSSLRTAGLPDLAFLITFCNTHPYRRLDSTLVGSVG